MATRKKAEPRAEAPAAVEEPYRLKYRPKKLSEVVGQDAVVKSVQSMLKSKNREHTFFLFGPGGTGKTTLARIIAAEFGCRQEGVIEVDAASKSGIDDMRELMAGMRYAGFGDSPNKAYIIDECQGLSKQAWDSLLKATEEAPEHVFFFFCSTNPGKIPAPMLTRGPTLNLEPVRFDPLMDLLEFVADEEGLTCPNWALETCARACGGSPRQALVMLAMVQDCQTPEEAEAVLQGAGETKEVIDLCRAMVKGSLTWADVQRNLKPLADLGAEGIRIQVTLYVAAVLMSCKEREAPRLLDMLAAFSKPCNSTDKLAPVLLAFGDFVNFDRR